MWTRRKTQGHMNNVKRPTGRQNLETERILDVETEADREDNGHHSERERLVGITAATPPPRRQTVL